MLTAKSGVKDTTVNVAALLTEPAVPISVLVTPPLVLTYDPATLDVTLTVTAHVELAATVPPLKATDPAAAAAVTTPPVQVVVPLGVAALTKLLGYVSVKLNPLNGKLFGLVIVRVKRLTSPELMEAKLKLLVIVGLDKTTKFTGPEPVPAIGV